MENAEKAIMIAFAVIVLGIALALSMFMFSRVTVAAEQLAFYSDSTIYYDNVEIDEATSLDDEDIKSGTVRIVSAETIIPTLYRYYKENFCVKIYDATGNLKQIFDVNLEGMVHGAKGDTLADPNKNISLDQTHITNYFYDKVYNNTDNAYCLFGAPWLGSTDSVKMRIDYFVNGKSGYINNTYVDYKDNDFYEARIAKKQFKERFINYSYTGQTMITEDGDELVTGAKSKDKIVIIYTLID